MNGVARVLSVILAAMTVAGLGAAQSPCTLAVREPWSTVLAGSNVTYHLEARSSEAIRGRVSWSLATGGRTLARGELAVNIAPSSIAVAPLSIALPAPAPGVAMPLVLAGTIFTEDSADALATCERTVWLLPSDPFAGRTNWMKELRIRLFDPEKKTAETFVKAGIPHEMLHNLDAATERKNDALFVVGEGVSFRDYRSLPQLMLSLAATGTPVLCLAPAGGEFALPGMGGSEPRPERMVLRRTDVIAELDKRLDSTAWAPDGRILAQRLYVRGARGPVEVEVSDEGDGWPWIEVGYPRATFLLCGFAVIAKWDQSATPRHLLAALFDRLKPGGKAPAGQGSTGPRRTERRVVLGTGAERQVVAADEEKEEGR